MENKEEKQIKTLFGERLRSARLMRGFSMDGLSNAIGNMVSKQSLAKYERGKSFPNSTVFMALTKALNLNPDYFVRPFSVSIDKVEFRKKSSVGIKEEQSIKEIIRDQIERYIEVESILGLGFSFLSPDYQQEIKVAKDAEEVAMRMRQEWKLGEDGIPSIIEMLEEHGIKVVEIDAPEKFDGLSGFIGENMPIIVLNKNYPVERKRFTALHELGHIVLRFSPDKSPKEKEQLCHAFANEMLLPISVFCRAIGDTRHDIALNELVSLQNGYGISVDAMMFKAQHHGVISSQRYRYYCIHKNQSADFKKSVNKSMYRADTSQRFRRLTYRALASGIISIGKAAALLDQPVYEVRNQLELV